MILRVIGWSVTKQDHKHTVHKFIEEGHHENFSNRKFFRVISISCFFCKKNLFLLSDIHNLKYQKRIDVFSTENLIVAIPPADYPSLYFFLLLTRMARAHFSSIRNWRYPVCSMGALRSKDEGRPGGHLYWQPCRMS